RARETAPGTPRRRPPPHQPALRPTSRRDRPPHPRAACHECGGARAVRRRDAEADGGRNRDAADGARLPRGDTGGRHARSAPAPRNPESQGKELGELIEGALTRLLVGPPAQQLRSVTETASREVVVAHFADERRGQSLPFARTLGAPAARPAWSTSGKTAAPLQRLHDLLQTRALRRGETRRETDMIQLAGRVVETEQERSDRA